MSARTAVRFHRRVPVNERTHRRAAADLSPIVGEGGKMREPTGERILTDEGGAEHDIALRSEMLRIPLTRHGFAVPPSPTMGGGFSLSLFAEDFP